MSSWPTAPGQPVSLGPIQAEASWPQGLLAGHAGFDRLFIWGVLAVALGLGALASVSPAWLLAVLWLDTWLFANPHLVATYTRLGAGEGGMRRHRFLIFVLPLQVLVAVVVTALAYEVPGLFTLYFVAQTYHVTRQSYGIARAYRRASGQAHVPDGLTQALIYGVPAWGLLMRCAQGPQTFLGLPISLPVVPMAWAQTVGLLVLACAVLWLWRLTRAVRTSLVDWRHDGFVASHVLVSLVAFVAVPDITLGWLVLNLWHNLQYLLFVWAHNLRRDQQRVGNVAHGSALRGLLRHGARYAALCLVAGAVIFMLAEWLGARLLWLGLPTVLIVHFTLNFHHYLVDGVIWKRRRFAPAAHSGAAQR